MVKVMNPNQQIPILLVGGLAMKADEHFLLAKKLEEKISRPILYFDNINVGTGPRCGTDRNLTIEDQALHQWNQVTESIGSQSKISIYGISMGGMITSTMASLFPERVHKLVLAATSANLKNNEAIPDDLFAKWSSAKHEDDIRATTRIAFGKTTLKVKPQVYEDYFQYRINGKNQQKAKEFIQQLVSIRSFNGAEIYSNLASKGIDISILSGEEDQLFDRSHLNDIVKLLPQARHIPIRETGHMLHLENLNGIVNAILTNDLF